MEIILKKSQAREPFSFAFIGSNGKTLLKSENYKAKSSATKGIASVRKNAALAQRYESKTAKNGASYFNLKASNGQIIGTSALFATEAVRDAAIEELQRDAASATLKS